MLSADFAAATGVLVKPEAANSVGGAAACRSTAQITWTASRPLRRQLPPGLAVAGAAWDGVGVPACLASGTRAAESVLAGLVSCSLTPAAPFPAEAVLVGHWNHG